LVAISDIAVVVGAGAGGCDQALINGLRHSTKVVGMSALDEPNLHHMRAGIVFYAAYGRGVQEGHLILAI
jgi:hypothetical protein